MCRISAETVMKANERTIVRYRKGLVAPCRRLSEGITVKVFYNGRLYTQQITDEQLREAYGKALKRNVEKV